VLLNLNQNFSSRRSLSEFFTQDLNNIRFSVEPYCLGFKLLSAKIRILHFLPEERLRMRVYLFRADHIDPVGLEHGERAHFNENQK